MVSFSIIMPLYNKAAYVRCAIESVLNQTFPNWELVIIDDGSTDGGGDIVAHIEDSRIQYHYQSNTGVATTRNNCVEQSSAHYLCFLDADDWWAPTFLEEMQRLIAEFPEAGIYGTNYTIFNETKHKTRVAQIGVPEGFERGMIDYCKTYAKTMYMPLWTGAVCIPRNVFYEMGGFPKDIRLGEDFLLWIRIALKYPVVFLNKPLSFYNQDVDSNNRGVGKLHRPEQHMLWNLDFLSEEEKTNEDYKVLIDNLRAYNLLPYYLSKDYHELAKKELDKVDWSNQPQKTRRIYQQPLVWLRITSRIKKVGSKLKQQLRTI